MANGDLTAQKGFWGLRACGAWRAAWWDELLAVTPSLASCPGQMPQVLVFGAQACLHRAQRQEQVV